VDSLHIIYWSMAGVGTLVVVVLLILGLDHDFDFGGDVDVGFDTDVALDMAHDLAVAHEGPSPLGLKTIMAFVGGWGWGGLIGLDALKWGVFSLPFGMAVGLALAAVVFYFMRFLYAQEATSTIGVAHMVGQPGVVLTTIPSGGTGEIRLNVQGTSLKCLARSESEEAVPAGATVSVVEEVGGTLLVRPIRL